ncbi:GAF domain-containing protein [Halostreptopolyspora alba]|uniref:GAF domain-containing protein n=1 Tax=Halostreptopolyspora alba TaxID=2487137 RepID=A0A3N0E8R7_9ACTN|nr:GAF domain-containing protein [Nocardiopsaceae bacterium YIM 96095]
MAADHNARDDGSDVAATRRRVARAHEQFLTSGRIPDTLPSLVRDSWKRSLDCGVDPEGVQPHVDLCSAEVRSRLEAHPLAPVMPLFRRLLLDSVPDGGHIIAIADADGRLLQVEGDRTLRSRAEVMHFVAGADWREQAAGTNAPGLAIALDHEVRIFATEHFGRNVHPWSCSAAPVHDPDTGALLGVVDLTGSDTVATPHALALVRAAATAAETELRVQRLNGAAPPAPAPQRPRLRALGRDRALLSANGRTIELSTRHSEILLLLTRHPEGLTGEALAARLHEHDSSPVTVRAELSRLRRLLGGGMLDSRPYRLRTAVSTDVDEVRRQLRSGDYRAAVQSYPGPLLPSSEAPGIADAREELTRELCSVLVSGSAAEALLIWSERSDGRDDPRVLQAALDTLPSDSPRAAMVAARLARLA